MGLTNVLAVIPVARFEPALDWYGRLFGRPPDLVPMPGERVAEWQLTPTVASRWSRTRITRARRW